MSLNYKFFALILCFGLCAFAYFLWQKNGQVYSKKMDLSLGYLCAYAQKKDVQDLSCLIDNINSSWWKSYALSRLRALNLTRQSNPEELCADISFGEHRAYLLAHLALADFSKLKLIAQLGEKNQAFARLIYDINKNNTISQEDLLAFKKRFDSDARHIFLSYAENLEIEAEKCKRYDIQEKIITAYDFEFLQIYMRLTSKGVNPETFKFKSSLLKRMYKTITSTNDKERKSLMESFEKDFLNSKKYHYYPRGAICRTLWIMGEKEKARPLIRTFYKDSLSDPNRGIRAAVEKTIIEIFASTGDIDSIRPYIDINAGNMNVELDYLIYASKALGAWGFSDMGALLYKEYLGENGAKKIYFPKPAHPEFMR